MNRTTYISLLFFTLGLTAYTGYYAFTRPDTTPLVAIVATTTLPLLEEIPAKNILTTQSGKTISVKETNPAGESLSTITLMPKGFEDNTEITLEKNKLTNFFLVDMDKDGYDELVLVTTAQGSGSYGEVTLFSTKNDRGLTRIITPEITEETIKKGAILEGYAGHDNFLVENGMLIREFPLYNATDTNAFPTGGKNRIAYILSLSNDTYNITLEKETSSAVTASSTLVTASTTLKTASSTLKVTASSSPQ